MKRALELARLGEGLTRPNPPVGAVLVKAGRVIGEGFHRRAGGPHAEIEAIRRAGARARGSTLYVTLEPCCTWGRTPPCTEAIVRAGIGRVVAATKDPNPRHRGRGLKWLESQRVEVRVGILEEEAQDLIRPFAKWITTGRPWVTLKLAVSLDGKIGDSAGRSQWISSVVARKKVHELRRKADALMVGVATVRADNPHLIPRPAYGRKPFRVIIAASRSQLPENARVFSDKHADRTILAVPSGFSRVRADRLARRGIRVLKVDEKSGKADLQAVLEKLGKLGILHVVCEGGGKLAGSLLRAQLVDELWVFYSPVVLGEGIPMVSGPSWRLQDAPRFNIVRYEVVGSDVLVVARPRDW